MTALLIDDEPAANAGLRRLLQQHHRMIDIVGEAANVPEGLQKISQLRPDLIFLDIEMPPSNGFELVRQLPQDLRPEVIFVTSRGEHALQAFNCAALGYVLKPVERENLATTVARAAALIEQKNSAQRLETLLKNLDTKADEDLTISIPQDSRVEFVRAGNITHCSGEDGYTRIHLDGRKSLLSSYPIGQYGKMLTTDDFMLVHKSFVVNRKYVSRWSAQYELQLSTGEKVPVGRRRKKPVSKWLKG